MSNLSYEEKVSQLKNLSDVNFTNRTMLMLTGAEDLLTQERYKSERYYIDMIYDLCMPELSKAPAKPSKLLTAIAFNGSFRPEDYQRLVDVSKKTSADELKEFLTQKVDHEPRENVVNYLSFPMLGMMTQHLKPWEAVDVLLLEPTLIEKCFEPIRSKALNALPQNTYLLLQRKAPSTLQSHLKINKSNTSFNWQTHFSTQDKSGYLDGHFVEAMSHWATVRDARKMAPKTESSKKISQWMSKYSATRIQASQVQK